MLFKFRKIEGGMRFSRSYGPRNDSMSDGKELGMTKKEIPDQVGDDDTGGKGPE